MPNLLQVRQNLAPLANRDELVKLALKVVYDLRAYLIDLNQIQLEAGQDAFGKIIGTYSPNTEFIANNPERGEVRPLLPKRAGEPYNFQWTGGLFDGMTAIVGNNKVIFTSTDSKTPFLVANYGELFGLTQKNYTEALKEKIIPAFVNELCNRLGL